MDDPSAALERARAEAARLVGDLEHELAAIAESTAESPDDEHDAEGSTVGFERARVQGLLERARRSAADIEAAIQRAESGRYGLCVSCGRPIAAERLEVLPAAARCVDCLG
ncbi:MAG TPA: TraR/DksA C4-type zinc finger protein [Acidimicrobiales bacterium]|nr:TraR/DksA C4-type zinc finger protein [Acidimicrobiales bacterium]